MPEHYVLAKGAAADMMEIIRHTNAQWGEAQCRAYTASLRRQRWQRLKSRLA